MANKLKVSVVITILNEQATIGKLLTGLEKQTYQPDQIVIVDGGSSDKTLQLIKSFKRKKTIFGEKIKILTKKGNRSVGRNFGIAQADNDWVAITDAGCIPHDDWLEKMVDVLKKQEVDKKIVVAGYYDSLPQTAFERAVVPYVLVVPDRVNPKTFLPATRSIMFHKFVWRKVGRFDEQLNDNEDYALARRLQNYTQGTNPTMKIVFAKQAKVSWIPRKNLRQFMYMIFRFARGDAFAGVWRPKVGLIFLRYGLGMLFCLIWWQVVAIAFLLYLIWSVKKNYKYVKSGWYWLPVLQITSDLAVMAGSCVGWGLRLRQVSR